MAPGTSSPCRFGSELLTFESQAVGLGIKVRRLSNSKQLRLSKYTNYNDLFSPSCMLLLVVLVIPFAVCFVL